MFGDKLRQVAVLLASTASVETAGAIWPSGGKFTGYSSMNGSLLSAGSRIRSTHFYRGEPFEQLQGAAGPLPLAGSGGEAFLAIFAAIRHVDVVGRYDTADRHIFLPRAANAGKNLKFWLEFDMRVGDGVLRWMRSGTGLSHNDGQSWPTS